MHFCPFGDWLACTAFMHCSNDMRFEKNQGSPAAGGRKGGLEAGSARRIIALLVTDPWAMDISRVSSAGPQGSSYKDRKKPV